MLVSVFYNSESSGKPVYLKKTKTKNFSIYPKLAEHHRREDILSEIKDK